MTGLHFARNRYLSRRAVLRGSGVALSLPLLDAMVPAFGRAADAAGAAESPRRMFAICTNMGILPQHFFPATAGLDYEPTPYLDLLKPYRQQMTVFSGVSHPDVDGGHPADNCFLTAAPHPARGGFKNTISLDQYAAERIGHHTRFPSLTLLVSAEPTRSLSWTAGGAMIPGERKPSELFARLFLTGKPGEVDAQVRRLRDGRSLLDSVGDRARGLEQRLGAADREKLDEYLTGLRELERRMHLAEEWERKPKPVVQAAPPKDIADNAEMIGRTRLMFRLAELALQTDSTRLVTMLVDQAANAKTTVPGVTQGTHTLSHHGNSPEKLAEIRLIEEAQFREFRTLLDGLAAVRENGKTLLEHTMVLYGTQFGNTSSHSNVNLPVLLAGGGLRHAGHLAFDRVSNYPLCNLYVTILQRLGVDAGRFASSTGTMRGLV